MFTTRLMAGAAALAGFAGVGYNRRLSFEGPLLAAGRGALALFILVVSVLMFTGAVEAQGVSSALSSSVSPDGSTVVTIPLGDWATPIVELFGAILMAAVSSLIAIALRFLPDWLRPLITAAVQTAITNVIRQGVAYAIQWVEGFDKGKTISLDVGSAAVAVALRFVVDHAPNYLISLAGGQEVIKQKIIAVLGEFGIVLDTGVSPLAVAEAANDDHPALLAAANG